MLGQFGPFWDWNRCFAWPPCLPPGHQSPSTFTPFCLQQPLRLEPFQSWRKKLNAPREHPEAHDQEDGPELGEGVVLRTLTLLWEPSAFSASGSASSPPPLPLGATVLQGERLLGQTKAISMQTPALFSFGLCPRSLTPFFCTKHHWLIGIL